MDLHTIIQNDNLDAVKALVENESDIDARGKDAWTALCIAVFYRKEKMVKVLLKAIADVNARGKLGWTVLHYACGNKESAGALLGLGVKANVNAQDKDAYIEIIKVLLKAEADVNLQEYTMEKTVLHYAYRDKEIVKLLLEYGADVNIEDLDSKTVLHYAYRDKEIVKLLVGAKINVNVQDIDGCSALHRAARMGYIDSVKVLLEAKADVNVRNVESLTVLHYVVLYSYSTHNRAKEIVEVLLKYGANVNAQDRNGETALHYAVRNRDTDVVEVLLRYGANTSLKDRYGSTPKDIDTSHYIREIIERHDRLMLKYKREAFAKICGNYRTIDDIHEANYLVNTAEHNKTDENKKVNVRNKGKRLIYDYIFEVTNCLPVSGLDNCLRAVLAEPVYLEMEKSIRNTIYSSNEAEMFYRFKEHLQEFNKEIINKKRTSLQRDNVSSEVGNPEVEQLCNTLKNL